MQQRSLSMTGYFDKGKRTRREQFLADMERVVPWARLMARIEPYYPKGEGGRPPLPLVRMLRVYLPAAVLQPFRSGRRGGAVLLGGDAPLCRGDERCRCDSKMRPRSSTSGACWRSMSLARRCLPKSTRTWPRPA